MRYFESSDGPFYIKGRGYVFTGIVPEDWCSVHVDDLMNSEVCINNKVYIIKGTERLVGLQDRRLVNSGQAIGILVVPLDEDLTK